MKTMNMIFLWLMCSACQKTPSVQQSSETKDLKPTSSCQQRSLQYVVWLQSMLIGEKSTWNKNINLMFTDLVGDNVEEEWPIIELHSQFITLHMDKPQSARFPRIPDDVSEKVIISNLVQSIPKKLNTKQKILLFIDERTPGNRVSNALEVIQHRDDLKLGLIVANPLIAPPSLFASKNKEITSKNRAQQLEQIWASCPMVLSEYTKLLLLTGDLSISREEKIAILQHIQEGLLQCNCTVHWEDAKAEDYLWFRHQRVHPSALWVSLSNIGDPNIIKSKSWGQHTDHIFEQLSTGDNQIRFTSDAPPPPPPPPRGKK